VLDHKHAVGVGSLALKQNIASLAAKMVRLGITEWLIVDTGDIALFHPQKLHYLG
jgi:hypothetical protein